MSYFGLPEGIEYFIMDSDEKKNLLFEGAITYINEGFDIDVVIDGIHRSIEFNQMTEHDKEDLINHVISYGNEVM